jgi:N-formylglutamate amidohydrolase
MIMLPLLVSTPHCSGHVPHAILADMLETGEPPEALRRRLFGEGDPFTDEIFHVPGAAAILNAPASRFVADLNRERDEGGENGVIKLTDFDRRPFYPSGYAISPEARELRLSLYYDPYHQALAKALSGGRIRFFIDGHSMMAAGPAIGPDQSRPRPAVCVGNFGDADGEPVPGAGPASCPPELARRIRDRLEELLSDIIAGSGLPIGARLNDPFDGGHILKRYSRAPYAVPGVMIEINRALYLDEATLMPLPGRIPGIREAIAKLAVEIAADR